MLRVTTGRWQHRDLNPGPGEALSSLSNPLLVTSPCLRPLTVKASVCSQPCPKDPKGGGRTPASGCPCSFLDKRYAPLRTVRGPGALWNECSEPVRSRCTRGGFVTRAVPKGGCWSSCGALMASSSHCWGAHSQPALGARHHPRGQPSGSLGSGEQLMHREL